jgi:hypothetical protein
MESTSTVLLQCQLGLPTPTAGPALLYSDPFMGRPLCDPTFDRGDHDRDRDCDQEQERDRGILEREHAVSMIGNTNARSGSTNVRENEIPNESPKRSRQTESRQINLVSYQVDLLLLLLKVHLLRHPRLSLCMHALCLSCHIRQFPL